MRYSFWKYSAWTWLVRDRWDECSNMLLLIVTIEGRLTITSHMKVYSFIMGCSRGETRLLAGYILIFRSYRFNWLFAFLHVVMAPSVFWIRYQTLLRSWRFHFIFIRLILSLIKFDPCLNGSFIVRCKLCRSNSFFPSQVYFYSPPGCILWYLRGLI
jgi:hypothetical protein